MISLSNSWGGGQGTSMFRVSMRSLDTDKNPECDDNISLACNWCWSTMVSSSRLSGVLKKILEDTDSWQKSPHPQQSGGGNHFEETWRLCCNGASHCWPPSTLFLFYQCHQEGFWLVEIPCSLAAFGWLYKLKKKKKKPKLQLHTGCLAKMQSFTTAHK